MWIAAGREEWQNPGSDKFRFLDFQAVDPLGFGRKPDKYKVKWGENRENFIEFSLNDPNHQIFGDNVGIDREIPITIISTTEDSSRLQGEAKFCKACGSTSEPRVN